MKAIVCSRYGTENLALNDVEKPAPKDDEVLVEVHASSVNTANLLPVIGKPLFTRLFLGGFLKPKKGIPGGDVAGRVAEVGKNVSQFRPGDEVFGAPLSMPHGAFAEYMAVPAAGLAPKPAGLSFEEAAAVREAAEALSYYGNCHPKGKVVVSVR
jgi:NADPH:quinone reductase-like Zn-dependent oxidoreductase